MKRNPDGSFSSIKGLRIGGIVIKESIPNGGGSGTVKYLIHCDCGTQEIMNASSFRRWRKQYLFLTCSNCRVENKFCKNCNQLFQTKNTKKIFCNKRCADLFFHEKTKAEKRCQKI